MTKYRADLSLQHSSKTLDRKLIRTTPTLLATPVCGKVLVLSEAAVMVCSACGKAFRSWQMPRRWFADVSHCLRLGKCRGDGSGACGKVFLSWQNAAVMVCRCLWQGFSLGKCLKTLQRVICFHSFGLLVVHSFKRKYPPQSEEMIPLTTTAAAVRTIVTKHRSERMYCC